MNFGTGYSLDKSGSIAQISAVEARQFVSGAAPAILVLDDEETIVLALTQALSSEGYDVYGETSPHKALDLVRSRQFAAILSDQRMPGMTGLEFLAQAQHLQPHATRILITGVLCLDTFIEAINKGEIYRFLVKPWIREELLMSVRNAVQRYHLVTQNAVLYAQTQNENLRLEEKLQQLSRQTDRLTVANRALEQTIRDLIQMHVRALDLFLPSLGCQSRRAYEVCTAMSDVLALAPEKRQILDISAWLHDIGLLEFPRALIIKWQNEPQNLTDAERQNIERHSIAGESLARLEPPLNEVGRIIRVHHERFDGSGYPDHLSGAEIPWLGRLLAVAVAYASSNEPPGDSARTIQMQAGQAFDPEAVRLLMSAISRATVPRKHSQVALSELRPGMRLARGVYASNGKLLIPEGQCLTPSSLDKVLTHNKSEPLDQVFIVYC